MISGSPLQTLAVLGSTGSIGTQVLEVVRRFPERYRITGLAAGSNGSLLQAQIAEFRPRWVSLADEVGAAALRDSGVLQGDQRLFVGPEGAEAIAAMEEAATVVSALVGAAGLKPTLAAIRAGKTVALANKEPLVMAGRLVMEEAALRGAVILPVDSEHSAIFQALQGQDRSALRRIILTASGGPFWNRPADRMDSIEGPEALQHPNWRMGPKITVDSATMMNKGLEVMEARWLFGLSLDQISVVIHPQSIVHSFVEFQDGALLAQLGPPDMQIPIAYALSYPRRLPLRQPALDLTRCPGLTFFDPDPERFPCLKMAWEAARTGGSLPIVLNAANEIAVAAFLRGDLTFGGIAAIINHLMGNHEVIQPGSIEEILDVDHRARREAEAVIQSRRK